MTVRRALTLIVLVAIAHGLFFIWYQRPDWHTPAAWTDQDGYRKLGEALATTGKFTRAPEAAQFVPEVLRTPVYPLFLATIYKVAGTGQLPVVLVQTALFALLCVFVYGIGRRVTGREDVAFGAGLLTALFAPIPYFAALVMTEAWTTFMFTASMLVAIRAIQDRRVMTFVALGGLLGLTALSRPAFALFPVGIVLVALVFFPLTRVPREKRPPFAMWAAMLVAFAITMAPWFTYTYVNFGEFTLSPAGGMGRGTWEGSWQATWSAPLQAELTRTAERTENRAALDENIRAIAAREGLPPEPMLEYVHQWWDIRRTWTTPTDPAERAAARIAADREYGRVGRENLRHQSIAHLTKRYLYGAVVLWAGEIPIRFTDIDTSPSWLRYTLRGIQALLFVAALAGVLALIVNGRAAEGCTLAATIVYVTSVHVPILSEARQSLPAQPTLLVLAAIGFAYLSGHLLPLKPQVHEREHL